MKTCSVCNINDSETRIIKKDNLLYCRKHYLQIYKHGEVARTIYDRNSVTICEKFAQIELYNVRGNVVGYTMIDLDDVDKCLKYKWHLKRSRNTSYAVTTINEREKMFLHRLILDYSGKMDVDHINFDGLDNRKSNLRIVSHSENIANNKKTGVKRVPSGKWQASICYNYNTIYIGTYDTEAEALTAREAKRQELRN